MEDAAIHELDIGDGNSLFAVFDGHGGSDRLYLGVEVSQCVKQVFVSILKSTLEYNNKDYILALDVTFRKIDEYLLSHEGTEKLK